MTQKIKFTEQYQGNKELAKSHRRQKQFVFCDLLRKLGLEVTDGCNLLLGSFDPIRKQFADTSAQNFLNDFIVVALLKGHFQGNKGYQLEILPSYNKDYSFTSRDEKIESLPLKIIQNKTRRDIPLGLRYKILQRDNFKCIKCGRCVIDGVKLHVDHKLPFSLGGLTEFNNLQSLCGECNIGKSNKYVDN